MGLTFCRPKQTNSWKQTKCNLSNNINEQKCEIKSNQTYLVLSWEAVRIIREKKCSWNNIPYSIWQILHVHDHLLRLNEETTTYTGCTNCGKCLKCSVDMVEKYLMNVIELNIPGESMFKLVHCFTCSTKCFCEFSTQIAEQIQDHSA